MVDWFYEQQLENLSRQVSRKTADTDRAMDKFEHYKAKAEMWLKLAEKKTISLEQLKEELDHLTKELEGS